MRIGIDATCWTNWRGFGRFTRSVIDALMAVDRRNEYTLFFDASYPRCEGVPPSATHLIVKTSVVQSEALSVTGHRPLADMARMSSAMSRASLDVVFCPSVDSYVPLFGRAARVVMVHDVIPEQIPRVMLPNRASRLRRRLKMRLAMSQAQIVATGSMWMSRQLGPTFGVAHDRIAVIPYGVATHFRPPDSSTLVQQEVRRHHAIPGRYLLHVGGFGPNKNIPALLASFASVAAREEFRDVSMVFVGKRDDDAVYAEADEIDRRLRAADLRGRVMLLGFQTDEALVPLYQAATALLLPSLVEGFGLPAIEAVSCGTPAVVTVASPLPALLREASVAVEPRDAAQLAGAMIRALTDRSLRDRARARAGEFGWEASGSAALTAFERAVLMRSRVGSRTP